MTLPSLIRSATFFISISLILFSCSVPEHDQKRRPLFPVKEYGRWGFIDDTGAKVVPCKFDYAYPFMEGMAAIQVDSLWGFIDETGEIVIPPKYISTDSKFIPFFQDGLCQVELKTDTGVVNMFIDKYDKVAFISPYKYWEIGVFLNGRARVEINDEICYMDKKGKVVLRTGFQAGGWFSEGIANLWMIDSDSSVYIDTTGHVLAKFSDFGNGDFHDGLAIISNDSTYCIDKTGKHVFTAERSDLVYHDFSDGMAVVYDRDRGYGFMDKTGRIVIPPKYYSAKDFYDGLSAVRVNGAWGFIDKKDSMVIAPQFDYLRGGFTNGICEVEKSNLKGYIDKKGKYIWREQYPAQYGKIDLKQWKLDTLEIHRALLDYKFETYFNYVRMGGFRYGNQLSLILDTTDLTAFADKYLAYKLYLINQTKDTVTVPIRGGRLKLMPQAINPKGEWQDLDIYDIFICGNEPHEYSMPPAGYQVFAAPLFKGSYKTKFRFKLYLEDKELYSNTYIGYMNPEQFVTEETRLW